MSWKAQHEISTDSHNTKSPSSPNQKLAEPLSLRLPNYMHQVHGVEGVILG